MRSNRLTGVAFGLTLVLVLVSCSALPNGQTDPPEIGAQLVGTVGPGRSITLKDSAGATISTLKAGTYPLTMDDLEASHNFHLSGPGVDVSTTVTEIAKHDVSITVAEGNYTFFCDPHKSSMNGSFVVIP